MLSAHSIQLDRRIVAEAIALADSGRSVTVLSVPTELPVFGFDKRLSLIMPEPGQPKARSKFKSIARRVVEAAPSALDPFFGLLLVGAHNRHQANLKSFFFVNAPREHFDMIHCHDLNTLGAGIQIRDTIAPGAKIIYDSHELFPYQYTNLAVQEYWSRFERDHIRFTDAIITVNESIASVIEQRYRVIRPTVVYNSFGVDGGEGPVQESVFLNHFSASPGGFRVIFQGNLSGDRNLRNLVMAFGMLDQSVKLFFLGSGPEEKALRRMCSKNRISNVYFGPWVPQNELLGYLRQAQLGIIPYLADGLLNNLYCTPNKLFEFIEAGVATCASDLPELRRIVDENGFGKVYPMNTAENIAQAVQDCAVRCREGQFTGLSTEAARQKYEWTGQARKLREVYSGIGA